MHSLQSLILILSLLTLFCVFASKFLTHFGVPILIFFIGIGIILGSEGIFGVYFDNPQLTREIGNVALCFIIFFGGMELNWKNARPIIASGLVLSTVGVLLTTLLIGFFAHFTTGMPLIYSFLLGAIASSTDAASVFSTLHSQKLNFRNNIANLLELESGSNDPMAYMLTIILMDIIINTYNDKFQYVLMFVKQLAFGAIIGIILGISVVNLLKRIRLNIEGLYLILGIALMLFSYSVCTIIDGNSFLAVYIAGLIIGNSSFVRKMRFIRFFEGQSWIAQIILFVTLGLQVFPNNLISIAVNGLILSLALIFIIRPLIVIPILSLFKIPFKQQLLVSLIGFRGAASIVFATYPLTAGLPLAQQIFDIVFFISISSIIFQGAALKPLARVLNLLEDNPDEYALSSITHYAEEISDVPVLGVYVLKNSPAIGKTISDLEFPIDIRIVAIRQNERYLIPTGQTIINFGDRLLLTCLEDYNLTKICEEYKFKS